ncbi:hypothetical protein MSAN_01755200 [Mycena sanguinolenta]|uniref:DUF6534 domain-containing protein n=1 Tax=Mycena sanguinolenta TaxID=230812 RepID=A0A8H7CUM6_9AGAR|nr:hypothetical protein MSAN_01755200 [Mycena sanguinolenta]
MAPVVIPGVIVSYITGPVVLGYMWSYCLYGMLIVQVYLYSEMFPNDSRGIKAFVWSMFFLETVFTLLITIAAWNDYGPGWGDIDTLSIFDWSWDPLPPLSGFLAGMAQSFYIWRISKLTKKRWVLVLIASVMITQVTVAFYYGIRVALEGRTSTQLFALSPEITLWLIGSAVCDVSITVTLVIILSAQKRRTSFQRTTGVINKLIRFSVETGCVTSVGAIIDVTLWLTTKEWNFHLIAFLVLGKLYSNVLMATLNCRAPLFRSHSETTTAMPQSSLWAEPRLKPTHESRPAVHISRNTDVTRDTDTIIMTLKDFNDTAGKESTLDKSYRP